MGLLGSLFGKSDAPITDPDRLRDELFAAARANQVAALEHFRT
jgi:hypothetical protein